MTHFENSFRTSDGLELYAQNWQPNGAPRAVIALVHGLGEHSGRYAHVAETFAQHGFATYTFDLRGHGKSPGEPRAYINSIDEHLSDTDAFLNQVRAAAGAAPIYLMGHSMGGGIVTLYSITRQPKIAGLIVSSGALKPAEGTSPLLIAASGIISKLAPKMHAMKLNGNALTRDPEMMKKALNDPLNYYAGVPARTGAEVLGAMRRIEADAASLKLPVLILHGTKDKLTNPEGSKMLYARAGSIDKTLNLYEGNYHETLNDIERERVKGDIVNWINQRINKN